MYQITFWDEVHNEQFGGVAGDVAYDFPRDENGEDLEEGGVAAESTKLHMKYSEKVDVAGV
jgi:hypothetical protein